ncbi:MULTISPECIES: hypothetical protein [Amycolatopsis]|nr:hypothetical protein [Amycolatopsis sacchari]
MTGKPAGDQWQVLRVLITVKAAPNPSATYGETVCVAGIRLDLASPGWVRLYPINFRDLESDRSFRKYDVVRVRARPARNDPRVESWRPDLHSLRVERHLNPWNPRRPHVEPYLGGTMCELLAAVRSAPPARSLAIVRPARIVGLDIEPHPGWNEDDRAKIDQYVSQLDLLGTERSALEAPRLRGWYRYRCDASCRGHRQGILDWEFVALQRRLNHLDDDALARELRARFLGQLCAPGRNAAFYVGNQAKRQHVFSVLGVYSPPR